MEKTTWRTKTLDAFSVSIDELEGLCSRLRQEFDNDDDVRTSIEFKFSDEYLTFDSVEDIKNHNINYKKVTKFTITIYGDKKFIRLNSYEFLSFLLSGPDAVIRSLSDKESWCAGVNEATVSYLKNYRAWYYFLRKRAIRGIGLLLFLLWFGFMVTSLLLFFGEYTISLPIQKLKM